MKGARIYVWLIAAVWMLSCSAQKKSASVTYEMPPEEAEMYEMEGGAPPAPAPAAAYDAAYAESAAQPRSAPRRSRSGAAAGKAAPLPTRDRQEHVKPADNRTEPEPVAETQPARMMVYAGYLKLRVPRLMPASDRLTAITEELGGFVDSLSSRHVVLRVPAAQFEKAMEMLAGVGETLARRISAHDVTEQFTDLAIRLDVARDARERLLMLLENTKNTHQRLRILQEIKRLTEQIETIEARLATLEGLVAYSTITVELQPVSDLSGRGAHRSPFPWVRALSPYRATIDGTEREFTFDLPDEFFLFEEEETYTARAADTAVIRGATVINEPRGKAAFWQQAIEYEMDGRGEELVDRGESGPLTFLVYRNMDVEPRYYMLALHASGEDLYVIEVFFPSEESHERHIEAVRQSLASFRTDGEGSR